MVLLLALILIIILGIEYIRCNKELASPTILFIIPFFVMTVISEGMQSTWGLELQMNTFLVVVFGVLSFVLGAYAAKALRIKWKNRFLGFIINPSMGFTMWKGIFFALFALLCYIWKIRVLTRFSIGAGMGGSLSNALRYYDFVQKRQAEITVPWPTVLRYMLHVQDTMGYIWACLLAHTIIFRNEKNGYKVIILINFLLSVIGSLTSGGRGASAKYVVGLVIALIFLYNQKYGWKKRIPTKYLAIILLVGVLAIYGFIRAASLVGRNTIVNIQRYVTNYIGVQLHNLNEYLSHDLRRSEVFGQETFYNIIRTIGGWIKDDRLKTIILDHPYIKKNGVSLGNVYTTFYAYIHDFGYGGVLFMPFIAGYISQKIYLRARKQSIATNSTLSISLIVYSYVSYMLVFSYFSNKFFELFASITMLRTVFWIIVVCYFLFGISFTNGGAKFVGIFSRKKRTRLWE